MLIRFKYLIPLTYLKIRNGLQQKNEKLINEMKSLEGANDEIKNDYCQLAAEKETIERHYENLESKLKSMNASKSSIQESAESLKLLQVRRQLNFLKWGASLCCVMRNLDENSIEKTHPTLPN